MKKIIFVFLLLFAFLLMVGCGEKNNDNNKDAQNAEQAVEPYKKAYTDFVNDLVRPGDVEDLCGELIYFDDDDIPELALAYFETSNELDVQSIYTYKNDEVKCIYTASPANSYPYLSYIPREGELYDHDVHMAYIENIFLRYNKEAGEVEAYKSFSSNEEGATLYESGESHQITIDEFNDFFNSIEGKYVELSIEDEISKVMVELAK